MTAYPSYWEVQATRPELRVRRTGGTCTAILQSALSSGMIDQAMVTGSTSTFPWARAKIVSTPTEIEQASGSKYTLVYPDATLLHQASRPYAAVTLPCMSRRARTDGAKLVAGLFCGLNISPAGYDRLLAAHGASRNDVLDCDFRSPQGGFWAELHNGKHIHVPRYFWLAYFYCYPMCVKCKDYLNRDADISIGDRRLEWNSVVVWNEIGAEALERAQQQGNVRAQEVSQVEFERALMTPYYQKEHLEGYDNHRQVRYRAILRRLPYSLLEAIGDTLYRRTVEQYSEFKETHASRAEE